MADVTRLEQFLNHIAHPEDPVPAPQTRMEHNLLEIAENKDEAALPDYSEASDGDVLAIDNGVPAWKSGGGGGAFTATITQTITPGDPPSVSLSCDKTFAEIIAAHEAGASINMLVSGAEEAAGLEYIISANAIVVTVFSVSGGGALGISVYTMASDNTITMHMYKCDLTQIM